MSQGSLLHVSVGKLPHREKKLRLFEPANWMGVGALFFIQRGRERAIILLRATCRAAVRAIKQTVSRGH